MEFNQKAIKKHLNTVAVNNRVTIQIFKKGDGHAEVITNEVCDDLVAKLIKWNKKKYTTSVVPQEMSGNGRKAKHVVSIRYLALDLDKGFSSEKIDALPIAPHIIVETSPSHFHIYYKVKCEVADFRKYALAIASAIGADSATCDVSHVFRVAGTFNWKINGEPFRAKLRRCENKKAIAITKLMKAFDAVIVEKQQFVKPPLPAGNSPSEKEVLQDLAVISSDERPMWRDIGMALHSWRPNESGYSIWSGWSKKSSKFNEDDQERAWNSFKVGAVGIGTLRYHANRSKNTETNDDHTWLPIEDQDIAECFAHRFSEILKHVGNGKYYVFDGHHWRPDQICAERIIFNGLLELERNAKEVGNAYAKKRLTRPTILKAISILKCMTAFEHLDSNPSDFDVNANLLGVPDGVIELSEGSFRAGLPSDMITLSTKAQYDPKAKCPGFKKFIREIMPNKEARDYLQTVCGYMLLGHANKQLAFFLVGKGSNGKGTFTRVLENVLGRDYFTTVSPSLLKQGSRGNPHGSTSALMPLEKARCLCCTEMERKGGIDQVFFKQMVGNDQMTGRENYGEQRYFTPPGKLFISTNIMPDLPYHDDAIWRRIKVIEFAKQFTENNGRNDNLDDELAEEAAGILAWMVRGTIRYHQDGFPKCSFVIEATQNARLRSDTVSLWLREECMRKSVYRIGAKEAHAAYKNFCEQQGYAPLTAGGMKSRLQDLGFHQKRKTAGYFYHGIKLN